MRPMTLVLSVAFAGVGVSVAAGVQPLSQTPPLYLSILSAEIEQEAATAKTLATSRVFFRLKLAARPPCAAGQASPSYAFLIDDDRSPKTGSATKAFQELGIDSRIDVICDPRSGHFVSRVDDVTLRPADANGAVVLEVAAPVRAFARADLHWIAVAFDGRRYTRLPRSGYGVWQSVAVWMN